MLMGMLVPENHWYGASRHTTYEEAKKPCPSSRQTNRRTTAETRDWEQQYNDAQRTFAEPSGLIERAGGGET